jgi:hypothetical protein
MNLERSEIVEILQCCLLALDNAEFNSLVKEGFNPSFVKMGFQLKEYLSSKEKWLK